MPTCFHSFPIFAYFVCESKIHLQKAVGHIVNFTLNTGVPHPRTPKKLITVDGHYLGFNSLSLFLKAFIYHLHVDLT